MDGYYAALDDYHRTHTPPPGFLESPKTQIRKGSANRVMAYLDNERKKEGSNCITDQEVWNLALQIGSDRLLKKLIIERRISPERVAHDIGRSLSRYQGEQLDAIAKECEKLKELLQLAKGE